MTPSDWGWIVGLIYGALFVFGGVTLFFIRRWVGGVDSKFAGLYHRVDELGRAVSEHHGFHRGLSNTKK